MAQTQIHSDIVWTLGVAEARTFTFDFTKWLTTGVTLSAVSGSDSYSQTLGVAEITTSALTIGAPAINTGGSITVVGGSGDETIATSKGVQVVLRASSATAGKYYELRCRVTTSAGDTLEMRQMVSVV